MERPKEGDARAMSCGSCYRSPSMAPEERHYACSRCGAPAYECTTCVRIGLQEGFPPITTCAACSRREEMPPDAW